MNYLKEIGRLGASNKAARHINRNLIFNLVRTHQPVSRADLAGLSGLQPSTVSLAIEELLRDEWLCQSEPVQTARGRRPAHLEMNRSRAVIAVDIHPLRAVLAVVDLSGAIILRHLLPLPQDSEAALKAVIGDIKKMMKNSKRPFDGIGISLPGRPDTKLNELVFAPNLQWPPVIIKSRVEKATGLTVIMDNVANACALSEIWFGDSDGAHDLVLVEVSEGLGTGIFVNGQILRGKGGMAGEFGHIPLDTKGPVCNCGNQGCWEVMASNRAALRYYREMGGKQEFVSFEMLIILANQRDKAALKALKKVALYLGRGMRIIASTLAPEEIVVVGEVTAAWPHVGPIVQAELERPAATCVPTIRPAYDGESARLRSAMALLLNAQHQRIR